MELPQQAASVLTPTAECSQVRVRPTPAPLSEETDKRMELVKHFLDFLYYYVIYDKQNCIGDYNIYSVMSFYLT